MSRVCLLPLFALFFLLSGCGTKETITPLYKAEAYHLADAHIQVWSDIDPIKVEPSRLRRITQKLVGWVPIGGDLLEIPMDLINVVFPKLPFSQHQQLPSDAEWNDPKFLAKLRSIRVGEMYLRITPKELRKDYEPEMCYFTFRCLFKGECECSDMGFEDFMSEARVYLQFKNLRANQDPNIQQELMSDVGIKANEEPQIFLAAADLNTTYDRSSHVLHFNVTDRDIRPYMSLYDRFEVKIAAVGKYPRRNVYMDGRVRIDLVLGLDN